MFINSAYLGIYINGEVAGSFTAPTLGDLAYGAVPSASSHPHFELLTRSPLMACLQTSFVEETGAPPA